MIIVFDVAFLGTLIAIGLIVLLVAIFMSMAIADRPKS